MKAQLLSVPPSILACLMTIACGFLSDRVKNRPLFIIIGVAFVTVGYLILAVDKNVLVGRMAAVFLIALANVAIIPVCEFFLYGSSTNRNRLLPTELVYKV